MLGGLVHMRDRSFGVRMCIGGHCSRVPYKCGHRCEGMREKDGGPQVLVGISVCVWWGSGPGGPLCGRGPLYVWDAGAVGDRCVVKGSPVLSGLPDPAPPGARRRPRALTCRTCLHQLGEEVRAPPLASGWLVS